MTSEDIFSWHSSLLSLLVIHGGLGKTLFSPKWKGHDGTITAFSFVYERTCWRLCCFPSWKDTKAACYPCCFCWVQLFSACWDVFQNVLHFVRTVLTWWHGDVFWDYFKAKNLWQYPQAHRLTFWCNGFWLGISYNS